MAGSVPKALFLLPLLLGAGLAVWWVVRRTPETPDVFVRIATFNVSLQRDDAGRLLADLEGEDAQAAAVAEILQCVRPHIVLLNEFDFDAEGKALAVFRERYLAKPQNDQEPLVYAHAYSAPVNTGVPSGVDLNRDGKIGGPADAYGFGKHPGQYGMVILSQYPIDTDKVRTFQRLPWSAMPNHKAPVEFLGEEAFAAMRLSSKNHMDVPVLVPTADGNEQVVHILASHPTPPVFDGPEDRNGRRNHDEIRLWVDYIQNNKSAAWIVDDQGASGGLQQEAWFVICGDLNADPMDGDLLDGKRAVEALLLHRRVRSDPVPESAGGAAAARAQWGVNSTHSGNAAHDTGDFGDVAPSPGNLRVDFVLPSVQFEVLDARVFWPAPETKGFELVGDGRKPVSSDHRLVYIDVRQP